MKRWLFLIAGVLLLTSCSSLKFWETKGQEGDGEVRPAKLEKFSKEIRIRKQWSSGAAGGTGDYEASLRPALGSGNIYAADNKGRVAALDAKTGKRQWSTKLRSPLSGGVGLGGGLVVVGTLDGEVYALEAFSGSVRWTAPVSSEVLSAPGANEDVVVVQTQDGQLIALDSQTGERRWKLDVDIPVLTLRGTGTPLVTSNMVIAGFATGKMLSFNSAKGSQNWENRVVIPQGRTELERMADLDGEPLLVDDVIYTTSYQGRIAAMSRGTGRNLWTQNSSSYHKPAYGLSQVYAVETDGTVRAFRAASGQVLWSNEQLKHRELTAPIVVAGYLAVADSDGFLHLLSQTDGRFIGRIKVDGSGVGEPMVSDGEKLYVLDNDGDITAYKFE